MEGPKQTVKSFEIRKRLVFEAWEKVQANGGAPGVDAVSIDRFGANEADNLYKLWNRMSFGELLPRRSASGGDTEGSRGRGQDPRRAQCGRPNCPDRSSDAAGREAGADLPPRQLWLSTWAIRP